MRRDLTPISQIATSSVVLNDQFQLGPTSMAELMDKEDQVRTPTSYGSRALSSIPHLITSTSKCESSLILTPTPYLGVEPSL